MANKSINITYKEKKYKLEFTKDTVRMTERRGFNINEVFDYPQTNVPLLLWGVFQANHRWIQMDLIEEIFEDVPDKPDFLGKLLEMYNEPISQLLGTNEDANKGKNAKWEATF